MARPAHSAIADAPSDLGGGFAVAASRLGDDCFAVVLLGDFERFEGPDPRDLRVAADDRFAHTQGNDVLYLHEPAHVFDEMRGIVRINVENDGRPDATQSVSPALLELAPFELLQVLVCKGEGHVELTGLGDQVLQGVRHETVGLIAVDVEWLPLRGRDVAPAQSRQVQQGQHETSQDPAHLGGDSREVDQKHHSVVHDLPQRKGGVWLGQHERDCSGDKQF